MIMVQLPGVFQPLIDVAILAFAIIAVRRHKLRGLRTLLLAAFLAALHSVLSVLLAALVHSGHVGSFDVYFVVGYVPFVIPFVALYGWCDLAFSSKKGQGPDA
jgi:hypothetical protein